MTSASKIAEIVRMFDAMLGFQSRSKYFESDSELEAAMNAFLQQAQLFIPSLSDEEHELLHTELQYKYKVFCSPGASIENDYNAPKWYSEAREAGKVQTFFWDRYAGYLIDTKGFAPSVVQKMDQETLNDQLMNFLADPHGRSGQLKRGLIIGDVQSGKTSTYIGLINKAADAGYKVFIILTGTIESLRRQTQERVDEGFVGIDVSVDGKPRVGVGLDNKQIQAGSMTSRKADFKGDSDQIALSLGSRSAIIFVIKKNTSVLTKLYDWLIKLNADPVTKKIDAPMLLIDDEADNASINTKSGEDPTKINRLIRQLVNVFSISNYVGFTATPFANVFIDPISEHDMLHHDLFPEDFIVSLPTPSTYIGAEEIFNPRGRYWSQVMYIDDAGIKESDNFPFFYLHKRDWDGELPESVIDAIYTFYLANAIRDIREDVGKHRSMLINMSRFTDVQYRIRSKVEEEHAKAMRAIKFNLSKDLDKTLGDPILLRLYSVWEKQYSAVCPWERIVDVLKDSVEPIEIKVVNSSKNSDKLVYPESEGIRVIAIGGLALSRGLTLEGLIVSYFYRNTSTYDVLMQMGRWFGYRRGYEDLFRIWTSEDSAQWYAEIASATAQLKRDMNDMRRLELKPREFGIRVRDDSDQLQITARNKMRNTATEYEELSFYGRAVETPWLSPSAADHRTNFAALCKMIQGCLDSGLRLERRQFDKGAERYIMAEVPKQKIMELLNKLNVTRHNLHFDPKQICKFLLECPDERLDEWDVVFIPGKKSEKTVNVCGTEIWRALRTKCKMYDDRLQIGSRAKLAGTRDGTAGSFDQSLIGKAEELFKQKYKANNGTEYTGDSFSSDTWFKYITDRRPFLAVYLLRVSGVDNQQNAFDEFNIALGEAPVVGFSIGIPQSANPANEEKYRYKVNKRYNFFEDTDDIAEGGDE